MKVNDLRLYEGLNKSLCVLRVVDTGYSLPKKYSPDQDNDRDILIPVFFYK